MGFLRKIVYLLLFFNIACSTGPKPTTLNETYKLPNWQASMLNKIDEPIVLEEDTILLDARPVFSFSLAHIHNSQHLDISSFNRNKNSLKGLLKKDTYFQARRLANLGVNEDSKVVVLGNGSLGAAEEGRGVWMLKYLGVKDVIFVQESYFRAKRIRNNYFRLKSKKTWKPRIEKRLIVEKEELKEILHENNEKPLRYLILDVRSEAEYNNSSDLIFRDSTIRRINIDWKNFINASGRTNKKMLKQLIALSVRPESRIVVISNNGYRSAMVTISLRELGFVDAGNFAGGYEFLNSQYWK